MTFIGSSTLKAKLHKSGYANVANEVANELTINL